MQQVWRLWGHVVVMAVLAVPAAVVAVRLLARRRARRGHPLPVRTAAADVAMVAGTVPWIWMILTPGTVSSTVSLIPFRDLSALLHAPAETAFVQIGGNLLVFAAPCSRCARRASPRSPGSRGWPPARRSPSSSSSTA